MNSETEIIERLVNSQKISKDVFFRLMETENDDAIEYLRAQARQTAIKVFGNRVYIRGLIEFTNYCKNDCYYCGIRRGNSKAERYRLDKDMILDCCHIGYELGFRTFVLQGGEDPYFTDERMCEIIGDIKGRYPDCALTLSIGERSRESYMRLREAGADRYLLRHETADAEHYGRLHPKELTLENRMQCLRDLKEVGFQTGCGFMVGSPEQTLDTLYKDLTFIMEFHPQMVGVGPFIPQKDTPFAEEKGGTLGQTLRLLSIIRLIEPSVLLPSTTALGTIHPEGRELGILSGANVVMPNLSPLAVREKYKLYDNKICTGDEAAESLYSLEARLKKIGYETVVDRGDYKCISD